VGSSVARSGYSKYEKSRRGCAARHSQRQPHAVQLWEAVCAWLRGAVQLTTASCGGAVGPRVR
jgi:hypothetical protein